MTLNFRGLIASLVIVLSSSAGASDLHNDNPQIQSANLTIEFDHNLRSRVVARFDDKDTTMGAFTSSESVTAGGKRWTDFPLTSQKSERVTDAIATGERLILTGKSGTLTKTVTVTMYDDFPAMAFFDVQYTNTGATKLAIQGWSNNAYSVNVQSPNARSLK